MSETVAYEAYFGSLNQSLQDSVKEASAAYSALVDVRTSLGLPASSSEGDGLTPSLVALATQVAAASAFLDEVTVGVLAGTRKVGFDAALNDFAIESIPGDTKRLVIAESAPGFALVPIQGGEGALNGMAPIIWAGVAASVVQATVLYLIVSEAADTVKVTARKATERTVAKTAAQYAKLVDEGKATPEQAKALTESLYASSVELAKATPPPPPPSPEEQDKVKAISSTVKTVAWIGLGAVVLYGAFRVAAAYTERSPRAALA